MRLQSARLRDYRLHHDLSVAFDPRFTVISGPNQSGKSTLVEALHRALFLPVKTGGTVLEGMRSDPFFGDPEVELAFLCDGQEWRLRKRFAANRGSVSLVDGQGRSLQGEEAEERLAALIGTAPVPRNRSAADQLRERWGHLWVWQGSGSDNPLRMPSTAYDHDRLVEQLQAGATLSLQSALDAAVIDDIQQRWEAVFTPKSTADRPRYKAGSEVHAAKEALTSAAAALAEVEALLAEQEQVRGAFEQAETVLARVSRERPRQEDEKKELEVRLQRCRELEERIGKDELILQGFQERLQPLLADQQQLVEQNRLAADLEQTLGPLKEGLQRQQEQLPGAEAERTSARQGLETLRTRTAQVEKELQDIEQRLERTRLRGRIADLAERLAVVERLNERSRSIEMELAKLPDIDAQGVEQLRRHQTEVQKAEATVAALATGLEVIRAGRPVLLDEAPLAEGETRQFSDPALLCIGDDVELRLLPGGGTSTADARRQLEEAGRRLSQALQRWKVDSVEEAATAERRRSDLMAERDGLVEQLGDSDPEELRRSRLELEARVAALPTGPDGTDGESEEPAALQSRLEQDLEQARGHRTAARDAEQQQQQTLTAAEQKLDTLRGEIRAAEQAIAADQKRLVQARTLIEAIVQRRGSAESLCAAITDLQSRVKGAEEGLATLRREREELGPENLQRRHRELEDSLAALGTQEAKAREDRIRAETQLHGDGRVDPQAEREQKQAEWEACRREVERLEKEARMLSLLCSLFEEERNAMANRYAAPLTERVGVYLQQVFPEPPVPSLVYDARSGFADLEWRRPGEALFSFEVLSTGAREQFAAALRAAMAEVLAAAYDGCLPLVFDDAFAHSDPERQAGVHRLLGQAADSGLQVILLTCDTERASEIPGAARLTLEPR